MLYTEENGEIKLHIKSSTLKILVRVGHWNYTVAGSPQEIFLFEIFKEV